MPRDENHCSKKNRDGFLEERNEWNREFEPPILYKRARSITFGS